MIKRVQYTEEEQARFLSEGGGSIETTGGEANATASPIPAAAQQPTDAATPSTTAAAEISKATDEKPAPAKEPPVTREVLSPAPKPRDVVAVRSGTEIRPLIPTTIDEVYRFAKMLAMTYNLPEAYYAAPKKEIIGNDAFNIAEIATMRAIHAIQIGAEVGIPPAQAVQSILVLNGVGTIWGDTQLGLCLASGQMESFREYTDGGEMWEKYDTTDKTKCIPNRAYTWVFETTRKGKPASEPTRFSVGDAIHAGIWGKKTWATHPGRMGKYKVRAFGLRDTYADILKGLCHSREEFEGEPIDVTPEGSKVTSDISAADLATKLLSNQPAAA